MKPAVRTAYRAALADARRFEARGDLDAAFTRLERAHILGQRHLLPHIVTHGHMLRIGWRRRDPREVLGQIARLAATLPGWLSGWVPKGNTGGADVSPIRPMPLPPDLQPLLADFHVGRDMALGGALLAGLLLLAVAAAAATTAP